MPDGSLATQLDDSRSARRISDRERQSRRAALTYIVLPIVFLTVTLLGGLRLAAADNAFIFLAPALICLALCVAVLMILFFRPAS